MLLMNAYIEKNKEDPGIKIIKYEDLAQDRKCAISEVLHFLGCAPQDCDYESLSREGMISNSSFGYGRPGDIVSTKEMTLVETANYRDFVPPLEYEFVQHLFRGVLDEYGYTCAPGSERLVEKSYSLLGGPLREQMLKLGCDQSLILKACL